MTNRIILGQRNSPTELGCWVSKPGQDVTSTDRSKFNLYMGYKSHRPASKYIITSLPVLHHSSSPSSGDIISWQYTFAHGLGYEPLFVVTISRTLGPSSEIREDGVVNPGSGKHLTVQGVNIVVNNTNVIIYARAVDFTTTGGVTVSNPTPVSPIILYLYKDAM